MAKKQATKFRSVKFKKKNVVAKLYHIVIAKTGGNSVAPDEMAHHELPHQELHCLQIQLFPVFGALRVNGKSDFS